MKCAVCALDEIPECTFVVLLSHYGDQWIFSRHKDRTTWETQGGHIEPNETPPQAAARELYEEAGATAHTLTPLCGYWVDRGEQNPRYGMLFLAEIERIESLPVSEMAEVRAFPSLPDALTYPDITPTLFAAAQAHLRSEWRDSV